MKQNEFKPFTFPICWLLECVGDSRAWLMTTKEKERQHRAEMREEKRPARRAR